MAKTINILPAVQVNQSAVTVDVEITEGGHTRTDQYAFNANDFDCNCSSSNPYVAKFMFEPGDITMILDVQGDFTTCQFDGVTKASAYALAQDVIADIGQYASAGGGGSYTFPTNHGNTAYVSVEGNDLTGVVGNISKPFETANAAIAALADNENGAIVILSSSGPQLITDYDYSTMPYTLTINDMCSAGISFTGSCSFGDLRIDTGGHIIVDTSMLLTIDNTSIVNCDAFIVSSTAMGDITFPGNINCNNFTVNANTNNPSLTFDKINWKNTLDVFEPITYNRCNPMVWKGVVSQSSAVAPTALVFENTLGETLTFDYVFNGEYLIISPGSKFIENKLFINSNTGASLEGSSLKITRTNDSNLTLMIFDSDLVASDGLMDQAVIQIEIYP